MMRDLGLIDHLPRLICAQAERADPLYRCFENDFREFCPVKAGATLATAIRIGNPVSIKKAIRIMQELDGVVEHAYENELANAAAHADRAGLFCCPQTAVALAALQKAIKRGTIDSKETVVVVSTASGLKFMDFKTGYHQKQLEGIEFSYANTVKKLPARLEKVNEAIGRFTAAR